MAVFREDPYGQYNFLVDLGDGAEGADAGFSEVSGLDVEIDVIEYRSGSSRVNSPVKLGGLVKYGNVTLTRGIVGSVRLWEWIKQAINGDMGVRRTVTIQLLDEQRQVVLTWRLVRAWPVRHVSGPLIGGGTNVAVEELVIAHEGMEVT